MLSDHIVEFMKSLPERAQYSRADLLVPALKLREDPTGRLVVYDAPFSWVNREARVALIGVTPGFTQMEIAYRTARRHLLAGSGAECACMFAKYEAGFGGAMRRNLVDMLDDLGLNGLLELPSCAELFAGARHLLHTTSAIRYPTFVRGRNYTGSGPAIKSSAFLMQYTRDVLAPELRSLKRAVFVPLGRSVGAVMQALEAEAQIPANRTLLDFPHPSGANGHRKRQFRDAAAALRTRLRAVLG